MSNEESKTNETGSSQPSDASLPVLTLLTATQFIVYRPRDDLTSLEELPGPSFDDTGWPPTVETAQPASGNSALCPSAHHRLHLAVETGHCLRLRLVNDTETGVELPLRKREDADNVSHLSQPNESSFALLISGRDVADVSFTQTCLNDVNAMQNILSEPNGIVPENNVVRITPNENQTEPQIEEIYRHISIRKPDKLFLYYSGHAIAMGMSEPRLDVGDYQANALNLSRLKNFIKGLLPTCAELFIMIDSCAAAKYLLLPILPANVMPNRIHIQWSSSKRGGISFLYAGGNSVFTTYVISALTGATACPNLDENCPLCSRLRRSVSPDGCITSRDLMEYVHGHMMHSSHRFSFSDCPQFMNNPVAR